MHFHLLQNLYVGVLLFLMLTVVARNLRMAVTFYMCHAVLLTSIFFWYGYNLGNHWFYVWSCSCFCNRVLIIPLMVGGLFYTINKMPPRETKPLVSFGPSMLIVSVIVVAAWKLFHVYVALIVPSAAASQEPSRTNLAIALTVFLLGLFMLLTRRDPVKTVLGLIILEDGIHLTLVDLTPNIDETVLLGMTTSFVLTVFILLYLSRLIFTELGIRDTVQLSELRY